MGEQRRIGRDSPEQVRIGWQMAGLGFQSTSEVIAGALLGWLWDLWRGTAPTGVLIGSITGLVVGLYTLVRQSLRLNRRLDEITRQKRASRGKPAPPPPAAEPGEENEDDWDRRWNEKWSDDDQSEPHR